MGLTAQRHGPERANPREALPQRRPPQDSVTGRPRSWRSSSSTQKVCGRVMSSRSLAPMRAATSPGWWTPGGSLDSGGASTPLSPLSQCPKAWSSHWDNGTDGTALQEGTPTREQPTGTTPAPTRWGSPATAVLPAQASGDHQRTCQVCGTRLDPALGDATTHPLCDAFQA